ncbi:Substrate binding domain of ABC-type glycine betaine transport system [Nocardia otitidiscaviarum]|uniref:Substrate binding domain of ABC-type glycine betaine transport system n=1 Tax=Nocardia otitidiscaviarum TaxID=1823 RepID=A0A378Y8C0_9NOCA|nr:glycine betaine ABC transporter substrate-binding protein [Nocardia otitidiscaviarum]SUA73088.1 Substrate binding domain of ABC-type glycine betaine transport system [Nocardia otitidiscaviarum]
MFGATIRFGRNGFGRLLGMALVVVSAAAMVSCARDDDPAIVVGAGDSAQARVVAEIYAGALARTGARTAVAADLGTRADYLAALDAATIAVTGDDTGDLLRALHADATATAPAKVLAAVYAALPEGIVVSDPADGTDLRITLTTRAAENLPATLPDLAPRCAELRVGITTGTPTDPLRPALDPARDVRDPLRNTYGCNITQITAYPDDIATRNALLNGEVQAAVLSVPPPLLPGPTPEDLTTIADPDYAFRAQQVLPVIRKGALTGDQTRKLNYVAGELTTADLAAMVRDVRDHNASPADLARSWLDAHAL